MAKIIYKEEFKQLQEIEQIADTVYKRRTIKVNIIDRVKEAVKVRWERMKKVEQVVDEIIYRLSDRGFSFTGREKLAEICKCSLSTVDKAIRILKNSGLFVVCYRYSKRSNACKTPVIISTIHRNYKRIEEILNLADERLSQEKALLERKENKEENKEEKSETPWYDWLGTGEKVSTFSFTKKQDNNKTIYDTDLIQKVSKLSTDSIVRYIMLKIADYARNGGDIKHLSSFTEWKFAHAVKMSGIVKSFERPKKAPKRSEEPRRPLPFYNWLEQSIEW